MQQALVSSVVVGSLLIVCTNAARAQSTPPRQHLPFPVEFAFETSWRGFDTSQPQVARWPRAARAADLDGDGDADLAVANWWAFPRVGIQLNHGGKLAPAVHYACVEGALDLDVADFNGDGRPDVAVSNSGANWDGDSISLLINLGEGTFAPQQEWAVASGSFVGPVGLAAADFNGDGNEDLAVALYGYLGQGTQVAVLTGDGIGGFHEPRLFECGPAPYKLAAGDLNADGRSDLVVARDEERLSLLLNGGKGFLPYVSYDVLSESNTNVDPSVELSDVDKDGDLDVLYSSSLTSVNFQTAVALLRNQGNGTLSPAQALFTAQDAGGAVDLAAGDVDGDGWPDIVGATGGRWSLLRGNGNGGFTAGEAYGATEDPVAVELADMDLDGDLDPIVVGRDSLEAAVYHNPGHGAFDTPAAVIAAPYFVMPAVGGGLDAADIDGDGDLDVAVAYGWVKENFGGITILPGLGDGTFGDPIDYFSPLLARTPHLVDLDGDALADLLWADDFPPYEVRTRINVGRGQFGPATSWPMGSAGNADLAALYVEGDGDLDIVLAVGGGAVHIRRNNGDGTFQAPYAQAVNGDGRHIEGADVDNDGKLDLLATDNQWIDVCLGNGDGTFRAPIFAACDWGPTGFAVADLDRDGALDLATANMGDLGSGGDSLSILRGWGDGSFHPPLTKPASYSHEYANTNDLVAGDVDGDGLLDLMVGNWGSLDVSYYRGQGNGAVASQVRYGVGWNTTELFFGDFTSDGRGDVLALVSFGTGIFFQPAVVLLKAR